jgi:hypothetical protein
MQREGLIEGWHDRRLEPGSDWDDKIRAELECADVILFLVSPDFLSSNYCYDIEVRFALEREARGEARVIPIILREVAWEESVFADLSALPTDGKAVCSAHWHSKDQAFTDIARGLRKLVRKIEDRKSSDRLPRPRPAHLATNLTRFHRKNPHFAGRESTLAELDSLLPIGSGGLVTMFGLGGVGKTQTAIEFAFRRSKSAPTWWLPAEEPTRILTEYCALAPILGIDVRGIGDLTIIARRIRAALEAKEEAWLLVFDNVDAPSDVKELLPSTTTGSVLLTTRNPNFGVLGTTLEIKPWDLTTATRFLASRTRQSEVGADLLAEERGALPLACEQAAAYIVATGTSISEYLALFNERRSELWGEEARHLKDIGERVTVSTVWELSFAKIRESQPAAIDLLNLLSFMAAETVPLRIISQYRWKDTGLLAQAASNILIAILPRLAGFDQCRADALRDDPRQ